jgi:hypothetical protein
MCLHQSSGNSFQWWTFPFFWVPGLFPASATSSSQQQLTMTELQRLSNSLTHQPSNSLLSNSIDWLQLSLSLSLTLRPTASRPVCLGIKHPSGAYDQIFITARQLLVCWLGLSLSDERTGLPFTIAADPRQRSHFRVRVPWDSWPYFTVSNSRLPFSSPPTTSGATVEVFEPASTRDWLQLLTGPACNISAHTA